MKSLYFILSAILISIINSKSLIANEGVSIKITNSLFLPTACRPFDYLNESDTMQYFFTTKPEDLLAESFYANILNDQHQIVEQAKCDWEKSLLICHINITNPGRYYLTSEQIVTEDYSIEPINSSIYPYEVLESSYNVYKAKFNYTSYHGIDQEKNDFIYLAFKDNFTNMVEMPYIMIHNTTTELDVQLRCSFSSINNSIVKCLITKDLFTEQTTLFGYIKTQCSNIYDKFTYNYKTVGSVIRIKGLSQTENCIEDYTAAKTLVFEFSTENGYLPDNFAYKGECINVRKSGDYDTIINTESCNKTGKTTIQCRFKIGDENSNYDLFSFRSCLIQKDIVLRPFFFPNVFGANDKSNPPKSKSKSSIICDFNLQNSFDFSIVFKYTLIDDYMPKVKIDGNLLKCTASNDTLTCSFTAKEAIPEVSGDKEYPVKVINICGFEEVFDFSVIVRDTDTEKPVMNLYNLQISDTCVIFEQPNDLVITMKYNLENYSGDIYDFDLKLIYNGTNEDDYIIAPCKLEDNGENTFKCVVPSANLEGVNDGLYLPQLNPLYRFNYTIAEFIGDKFIDISGNRHLNPIEPKIEGVITVNATYNSKGNLKEKITIRFDDEVTERRMPKIFVDDKEVMYELDQDDIYGINLLIKKGDYSLGNIKSPVLHKGKVLDYCGEKYSEFVLFSSTEEKAKKNSNAALISILVIVFVILAIAIFAVLKLRKKKLTETKDLLKIEV